MERRKDGQIIAIAALAIAIVFMSVGFAVFAQNLNINGTATVEKAVWDVHFDNVKVKEGSVTANTPVIDNMSNEVIVKYLDEVCKYQLKNDVSSYSQIYYYHGTKMNEYLSKKSAKFIKKNYSNSSIICFKGKGHCENSLLNSKVMISELDKILMKR